jgi:3-phosphoshikimate 1-carboxyvinyltransferase
MSLPDLIAILPLKSIPRVQVTVPGSKSITNRALILAALAKAETQLNGALWSEDTQVMVEALRVLGFRVDVMADPLEFCNRTIRVEGRGGLIPRAGTQNKPLELFVGNAGTAARFLAALVCLGDGYYRLSGVPRMHERPQSALFTALRQLGYEVISSRDMLPVVIRGRAIGTRKNAVSCTVSIKQSSQFASALILCADHGCWEVQVCDENADESPYVVMTRQLCANFPRTGGEFQIEPDASSGSYFWGVNALGLAGREASTSANNLVQVRQWPDSGWQIDAQFPRFLPLPKSLSRQQDLGDSIMTAIVLAPLAGHPVEFNDLGRLRLQECERVQALRIELTRCGAQVIEKGDSLTISSSQLHGADIETYNDHRMAMCFALLGLAVPGMRIKDPACVKKTFPNFFQKLVASFPEGLGATILNAHTREPLSGADLFAD